MLEAVLICPKCKCKCKCKYKEKRDKSELNKKVPCPQCESTAIIVEPEKLRKLNIDLSELEKEEETTSIAGSINNLINRSGIREQFANSNISSTAKETLSSIYDKVKDNPLFIVAFIDNLLDKNKKYA